MVHVFVYDRTSLLLAIAYRAYSSGVGLGLGCIACYFKQEVDATGTKCNCSISLYNVLICISEYGLYRSTNHIANSRPVN